MGDWILWGTKGGHTWFFNVVIFMVKVCIQKMELGVGQANWDSLEFKGQWVTVPMTLVKKSMGQVLFLEGGGGARPPVYPPNIALISGKILVGSSFVIWGSWKNLVTWKNWNKFGKYGKELSLWGHRVHHNIKKPWLEKYWYVVVEPWNNGNRCTVLPSLDTCQG